MRAALLEPTTTASSDAAEVPLPIAIALYAVLVVVAPIPAVIEYEARAEPGELTVSRLSGEYVTGESISSTGIFT